MIFGTIASNRIIHKNGDDGGGGDPQPPQPPEQSDFFLDIVWRNYAPVNNVFYIEGDYDRIQYSEDGITWKTPNRNAERIYASSRVYIRQKPTYPPVERIGILVQIDAAILVGNTGKVKIFDAFNGFQRIYSLNTSSAEKFNRTFTSNTQYNYLTLPVIDTSNAESFYEMFFSTEAREIRITNLQNGKDFTRMFSGVRGYPSTSIFDLPVLNTSKGEIFDSMFYGSSACIEGIDTTNATSTTDMFLSFVGKIPNSAEQTAIMNIPGIKWESDEKCDEYDGFYADIETPLSNSRVNIDPSLVDWQSLQYKFDNGQWEDMTDKGIDTISKSIGRVYLRQKPGAHTVRSISFRGSMYASFYKLDTKDIYNFNYMFAETSSVNVYCPFDVSSGTDFRFMFYKSNGGRAGTTVYPLYWNTGILDTYNGTNFESMFEEANMRSIPLIYTNNGTNFKNMFKYSYIDIIPNLDVSNGVNFDGMFMLSRILYPGILDTKNGTNFKDMFKESRVACLNLIDTTNATDTTDMFLIHPANDNLNRPTPQEINDILLGTRWENDQLCSGIEKQ